MLCVCLCRFELRLVQIMLDVFAATSQQEDPLLSEGLKMRVSNILRAWSDWNVYPRDFIMRLHSALNGIELKVYLMYLYSSINKTSSI